MSFSCVFPLNKEIKKHPSYDLLLNHAMGNTAEAESLILSCHVAFCNSCKKELSKLEKIGGIFLNSEKKAKVSEGLFENTLAKTKLNPKATANWIITEVLALANKSNLSVTNYPVSYEDLKVLLLNVLNETISSKQAKEIFERMWNNREKPEDIINNEGLKQISDVNELNKIVDNIIKNNYKSVEEYQSGKDKLFGFFVIFFKR